MSSLANVMKDGLRMIAASERVRKDLRGDSVHRIVNGLSVRIEERVTERLAFVLVTKVLLRLHVKFWSVRQVVKSFSLVQDTVVVYVERLCVVNHRFTHVYHY